MIIKRKLFANVTNIGKLNFQKLGFTKNIKSATGLANKKLARSSKKLATEISNITGDTNNSYIIGEHKGVVTYTYPRQSRKMAKSDAIQLDLFPDFPKQQLPPKKKSSSFFDKNKFKNTRYEDIKDLNDKRRWLEEFNSHRKRGKYVNQSGEEGISKLMKTNGMSMNQREGLIIPGFKI